MNKRHWLSSDFLDKHVPDDAPEAASARPYVTSYHIDSELGLYIFVETICRWQRRESRVRRLEDLIGREGAKLAEQVGDPEPVEFWPELCSASEDE